MIDAIALSARRIGRTPGDFFSRVSLLSHGTTVGTNAIMQKRGARGGLITT
jgi:N-methylhydantoinase A/oxoprolinase/acetone carboxylase beta subunit